ncbi:hypothetical protein MQE23_08760 [Streptomyces sp. HP-A2021]|uniref:hypothetical protein n=1 Tax=Streptomyces sp. HP-A2021 TaxID=2927875 RepID=UPI001FAF65B9|nr:hypothetical protein [Streptomyces sp. HP-A2021]UOB09142.1 hypothetical protein MQE23_08760 [Streptomyces sp. HP-A2021]
MANNSTQLSAATALTQLLMEHPDLPEAGWSIGSVMAELRGFVHTDSLAGLLAYQEVLGGDVHVANCYEHLGRTMRRHVLNAVWRDVPVEVVVALPVHAEAVAA